MFFPLCLLLEYNNSIEKKYKKYINQRSNSRILLFDKHISQEKK